MCKWFGWIVIAVFIGTLLADLGLAWLEKMDSIRQEKVHQKRMEAADRWAKDWREYLKTEAEAE